MWPAQKIMVHIDKAISQNRSQNRWPCNYRGAQRSDGIVHKHTSHMGIARRAQTQFTETFTRTRIIGQYAVRRTMQTAIIISKTVVWLMLP